MKTQPSNDREIVYKEIKVERCVGDKSLTAATAKRLLGWVEESENVKFEENYFLKDLEGNKVRCQNNTGNRPYHRANTLTYKQDILRRRWHLNGHNRIIGKYGSILSGQHVLTALVLAAQEWNLNPGIWAQHWSTEPTIETLICKGIEETDEVKNTIDTARPSTLSDVLFRTEHFATYDEKDRKVLARTCDYAVRLLWTRTGANLSSFAPRRTHSESMDFIARHLKLLDAVKHIVTENGGTNSIGEQLSLGYSSALLYLQACSTTEPDKYHNTSKCEESTLDFSAWDDACDFWSEIAGRSEKLKAVPKYLTGIIEEGGGSWQERLAVMVKAWNHLVNGKSVTVANLRLNYEEKDGYKLLNDFPTVGGIDLGFPTEKEDVEEVIDTTDEKPKTKPRPKKKTTKKKPKQQKLVATKVGNNWAEGDKAWVKDPEGDHYFGTITHMYHREQDDSDHCYIEEEYPSQGNECDVPVSDLQMTKPAV